MCSLVIATVNMPNITKIGRLVSLAENVGLQTWWPHFLTHPVCQTATVITAADYDAAQI